MASSLVVKVPGEEATVRPVTDETTGQEDHTGLGYVAQELTPDQAALKEALLTGDVATIRKIVARAKPGSLDFNLNTQLNMWDPSPLNACVRPEDGIESKPWMSSSPRFLPGVSDEERFELVELMLKHGATPDWKVDRFGHITRNTAAFQACYAGRLRDLELLHQYGADLHQAACDFELTGITLVMAAAADGRIEILEFLRTKGVDMEAFDSKGRNALHWLMYSGKSAEGFAYLLENGLDPFALSDNEESPFTLAIEFSPDLAALCAKRLCVYKGRMYNRDVFDITFAGFELRENDSNEPLKVFYRKGHETHATKSLAGRAPLQSVTVMELAVEHKRLELFTLPVFRRALESKWEAPCQWVFLAEMLHHVAFVIAFALFTGTPSLSDEARRPFVIGLAVLFSGRLVLTAAEIWVARSKLFRHLTSLGTVFSLVMNVLVVSALVLEYTGDAAASTVSSCAILFVFLKLLSFMAIFKETGPLVVTVNGMAADALRFFAVFSVIYVGFSHSFYVLAVRDEGGSYLETLLQLYFAVLGSWDQPDTGTLNKTVGLFMFTIWLVIATLGLLNVLIALFSNTFNRVFADAESVWLFSVAERVTFYEKIIPRRWMQSHYNRLVKLSGSTVREPIGKYKI